MADEDKDKAEKLAAAKKRFEQLKKEQQKKGKKGGAKKKKEEQENKQETEKKEEEQDSSKEEPTATEADESTTAATKADQESDGEPAAEPERKPSLSAASKQRSESFRAGTSPNATSPGPQGEVQEIYRKQAARIEELEAEVKAAKQQRESDAARLSKTEEELERLREGSGDLAELKAKAAKADSLSTELASVQRQLAQAQQAAKGDKRRASGASSDLAQQLESKTATIESLELDLSNLQNQVKTLQSTIGEKETAAEEVEQRVKEAEEAKASYQRELDALKVSISFPSDEGKGGEDEPEALKKRITVLDSDLRTANSNLEAASQRATSLEQKLGALTKLHKDATSSSQSKDKELTELRNQLKKRDRPSHVRDASEFELGEEETETGALQAKIRALEAENFDLRRGIWRDKRAELQPGMDDAVGGDYEDVDLNGPYSPLGRKASSGTPGQQSSSFQDVIASGISAFTGRPRDTPGRPGAAHARKASLGLLDDDDDIDEDAFRLAQEEEAKKRIERVKEVKRGLENWNGWRVDLAELRQQGVGAGRDCGPVFEI